MAEPGRCAAAVPVERLVSASGRMLGDSPVFDHIRTEPGWRECGAGATAVYEYRCDAPVPHVKRRETCPDHEPEPGVVGCRECWDAGTERPMTFTRSTL